MDFKSKIADANSLLSDIYEVEDARGGRLPVRSGLDAKDIQTLRIRRMEMLADELPKIVGDKAFKDEQRLFQLPAFRYGLEKMRPLSFRNAETCMAIGGKRVRRLEKKALPSCRKKERIQIQESVLKEYAYGLLASQGKRIKGQAAQGTGRSKNNPAAVEKGAKACEFEIRTDKDDGFAIVHSPLNKK